MTLPTLPPDVEQTIAIAADAIALREIAVVLETIGQVMISVGHGEQIWPFH